MVTYPPGDDRDAVVDESLAVPPEFTELLTEAHKAR